MCFLHVCVCISKGHNKNDPSSNNSHKPWSLGGSKLEQHIWLENPFAQSYKVNGYESESTPHVMLNITNLFYYYKNTRSSDHAYYKSCFTFIKKELLSCLKSTNIITIIFLILLDLSLSVCWIPSHVRGKNHKPKSILDPRAQVA